MITTKQVRNSNIVRIDSDGEWNSEDIEAVRHELRRLCERNGQVAILEKISKAGSGHAPLVWDAITATIADTVRVTHLAVIGDEDRIDVCSAFFSEEFSTDMRCFADGEDNDAMTWFRVRGVTRFSRAGTPQDAAYCDLPLRVCVPSRSTDQRLSDVARTGILTVLKREFVMQVHQIDLTSAELATEACSACPLRCGLTSLSRPLVVPREDALRTRLRVGTQRRIRRRFHEIQAIRHHHVSRRNEPLTTLFTQPMISPTSPTTAQNAICGSFFERFCVANLITAVFGFREVLS